MALTPSGVLISYLDQFSDGVDTIPDHNSRKTLCCSHHLTIDHQQSIMPPFHMLFYQNMFIVFQGKPIRRLQLLVIFIAKKTPFP